MTALLEDRVAAFVADHPGRTVEEIAIGVSGRRSHVAEILKTGPFFSMPGPRHSTVYRLTGRRGTATTHKQRVLSLLQDGAPHSHMEGYRLGVMLHSRVADLRKDGYEIRCWRDGDDYLYQLVGTLDEVAASTRAGGTSAASSSDPGRTDGLLRVDPPPEQDAGVAQLELIPSLARGAYGEAAA